MMTGQVDLDTGNGHRHAGNGGGARDPACRLALLEGWIERHAEPQGLAWFRGALASAAREEDPTLLVRSVALAPRRLGKADLILDARDRRDADAIRPGFDPTGLTLDQAARIALILATSQDEITPIRAIEALGRAADLGELIAICRGLPLFPAPESLLPRAADGLRSSIRPIFEAVAHRNPYPAEILDRDAWNQMVLKALFIGSPLTSIQRLDERANRELAAILLDYAHERWSAGRPVNPELWRCVGPFADGRALADLERLIRQGSVVERCAAALALSAANGEARSILARHPELDSAIACGRLRWASLY